MFTYIFQDLEAVGIPHLALVQIFLRFGKVLKKSPIELNQQDFLQITGTRFEVLSAWRNITNNMYST